jgi:hypothetical protein
MISHDTQVFGVELSFFRVRVEAGRRRYGVCVGPRIGMNPESLWGLPNLEY